MAYIRNRIRNATFFLAMLTGAAAQPQTAGATLGNSGATLGWGSPANRLR